MNFADRGFLLDHVQSILGFYAPNIVDPGGGFFQNFKDDGTVFNGGQRHLVSSSRMVFNYCKAFELFGEDAYFHHAQHGIDYIRSHHWDESRQGYNWTLKESHLADEATNYCYGLAFVMLCSSAALELGIEGAREDINRVYDLMDLHLWDASSGLYADEATADWSEVSPYRGQNANMHSCEALIAAYEATGEIRFLNRAHDLARLITVDMAEKSDGLIWEHFTEDLEIDWEFNKNDPKNLYRPWGFQPGHQTEWAKLLLTLHDHRPENWMAKRAEELFDRTLEISWDEAHGGIFYGFAPNRSICDSDKFFWVQAESLAASARLFRNSGETRYAQWYETIWQYSWDHMVDHQHGAWYRVLTADNSKYSDEKSVAGAKCDYHTIGACWDLLRVLG